MADHDSALIFPCEFPIKIVGYATDAFEIAALSIIHKHFPALKQDALKIRASKQGKYMAITVVVYALNRKQLDDVYIDLSSDPHVVMAL